MNRLTAQSGDKFITVNNKLILEIRTLTEKSYL